MPVTPEDCRATVGLPDGRELHIRAIRPSDGPVLLEEFHRLSPASVRARFFSSKKEMSAEEVRYLTEVDFVDHVALVAELPGAGGPRAAGVGRMVRGEAPDHAEVALTVAEGQRGLGIGTALLDQLVRLAPAMGVRHLDASVLVENHDMLELYRRTGLPMRTGSEEGTALLTLDLDGA